MTRLGTEHRCWRGATDATKARHMRALDAGPRVLAGTRWVRAHRTESAASGPQELIDIQDNEEADRLAGLQLERLSEPALVLGATRRPRFLIAWVCQVCAQESRGALRQPPWTARLRSV